MRALQLFTLTTFLVFPALIFSQLTLPGELRLGDTTQVHVLYTKSGDRLVGLVTTLDEEELTFLFIGSNLLVFSIDEINKLEVMEKKAPAPNHPAGENGHESNTPVITEFHYHIVLGNAEADGLLLSLTKRSLRLESYYRYIPFGNVSKITLTGMRLDEYATQPEKLHMLKTSRGDRFYGQLLDYDGAVFRFLLEKGIVIKVPAGELESIRLIKKSAVEKTEDVEDESLHEEDQDKLFFTPTAFNVKAKKGDFRNVMVLYNTVDYGITDHVSVGGGISTVVAATLLSGRVKAGTNLGDYLNVSVGGQIYHGLGILADESYTMGLMFGAASLGSRQHFVNIGIGTGRTFSRGASFNGWTVGGCFRFSPNWKFMVEYFRVFEPVYNESYGFPNVLFSWIKKDNRLDFGFAMLPTYDSGVFPFPVAAYSCRF